MENPFNADRNPSISKSNLLDFNNPIDYVPIETKSVENSSNKVSIYLSIARLGGKSFRSYSIFDSANLNFSYVILSSETETN